MITRINEYGVEIAVCCDTDMDLRIIHTEKDHRGWDENGCRDSKWRWSHEF